MRNLVAISAFVFKFVSARLDSVAAFQMRRRSEEIQFAIGPRVSKCDLKWRVPESSVCDFIAHVGEFIARDTITIFEKRIDSIGTGCAVVVGRDLVSVCAPP